jgi:LysM repeat protein
VAYATLLFCVKIILPYITSLQIKNKAKVYIKQLRKDIKGGCFMNFKRKLIIPVVISSLLFTPANIYSQDHIVKAGESLYTISKAYNVSISYIKELNNISSDTIYTGQVLKVQEEYYEYTVKSGDTLWLISQRFGLEVSKIKSINALTSDAIIIDQKLKLSSEAGYTVKSGDSLWIIANKYGITIQDIKITNSLTTDILYVGQALLIPKTTIQASTQNVSKQLLPLATKTYTVQAGDSISTVAYKFGLKADEIIKYNYLAPDEWLNQGQIISINGYAPRNYTVTPGESQTAERKGKIIDWYLEGQYLLNRGDVFKITDVISGLSFNVKMIGGYNHIDIETVSSIDTANMLKVFNGSWEWNPRAVVIFKDGMNIAASLSGMPHSFDLISGNNMNGHCDLYLLNSKPHGSSVSSGYVQQHYDRIQEAGQ